MTCLDKLLANDKFDGLYRLVTKMHYPRLRIEYIYLTFFRSLEDNEIDHLPARIFQSLSVLNYMYVLNFNKIVNKTKQSTLEKIHSNPLKSSRTFDSFSNRCFKHEDLLKRFAP